MRRLLSAMGVLASTLLLLAGLLHSNPFQGISDALDNLFGAPPKWTQVTNLYWDPRTQETTHGDDPVGSIGVLKHYWHERGTDNRVVFFGNSQMHAISLAAGELPPAEPEKTYVDLIIEQEEHNDSNEVLYRLSFSDMSYPEVLWDLNFMLDDPDLRPKMVVLQMNYQSFWAGGIRDSMLPMLRRPTFRTRIEAIAKSGFPDAAAYVDAIERYDRSLANKESRVATGSNSGIDSVFDPQITPGYEIETRLRGWLNTVSPEQHRAALKESFEDVLYRGRLYLLQLKPSTARSISGSRLLASRSAVDSIAALCEANHIRLLLFHAPVNPNVSLYRTAEDRQSYRTFVASIAQKYHVPVFDFENSIDAKYWGHLLNSPDPLHMGRAGHQLMAQQLLVAIDAATKN
jgi:hypothetical protein